MNVSSAGKLWLESFWMRKAWGDSSDHWSLYWNAKKSSLLSSFVQQMSEVLRLSMTVEGYRHLSMPDVITVYGQCFCTHHMVLTLHFQIVTCLVILKKHVKALLHYCWGTAEHHAPVAEEGEQWLWGENTCTCLKMEDYWQRWNTTLKNNSAFSNVILKF